MRAWLPVAPCTPQGCATHNGPAVGTLTAIGRLAAGIPVVLAGVVLTPLVSLLSGAHRDRLTRTWARTVIRAFGLRVRIVGEPVPPRGTGMLVVSNHISWLDIPLLAAVFPGRMLAKSEIRGWPVMGAMATLGGTIFVERERLRALPGTVRTLATAMDEGSRVVVFPEACTWCGKDHGRFTTAVFQAAMDADADVRPVRLTYRGPDGEPSGAPAFVGEDSLGASLWRVVKAEGLTAEIAVLPVIPAGCHADRRALSLAARLAVAPDGVVTPDAAPRDKADAAPRGTVAWRRTGGRRARGRSVTAPTASAPTAPAPAVPVQTGAARTVPAQTAVASDSAKRPASSVHQCASSMPAAESSARIPS
ncbi:1-acyl-sn-glycerol-3-phosphate acyltransferase [Streptomyces sp. GMY02]|uniref:lysophospholipid acyltransferase family protein n=1 Tax=Streptomyces sp. GMY02 TaxID=1333528 RepID=UPI001C2BCF45|nr:lysophospholipid acyltransferase family protein [Streptomyces sp. GMY02]QXE33390.1 1-acyl-sn-glycerol-3-phosphate acyltransferase [Streptomyces sp. GMY02]